MEGIDQIIKLIAKANTDIIKDVQEFERKFAEVVIALLKKFTSRDGILEPSASDFQIVQAIEKEIDKAIKQLGYLKAVENFLPNIDNVQDELLRVIPRINPKVDFSKDIVNLTQERKIVIDSLAGNLSSPTSIKANIKAPIKRIITNAVNNRMPYNEAVRIIKNNVVGDSKQGGRLSRYVKQVSTDALNQWSGTINAKVGANYAMVDYLYSGPTKTTSRPQCRRWLHKTYTDEQGRARRGYGGLMTKEMIEDQMQKAAKTVGRKTLNFSGYSSFAFPTVNNFAIIRGGHNCDDFATPFKATIAEAEAAIRRYNAIEGTSIKPKYNEFRLAD